MEIKERLKALRKEAGLTQQEVADRLGVNHVTISGYERGVRKPGFEEADQLADLFDVNLEIVSAYANSTPAVLGDYIILRISREVSPHSR